LNSPSLLARKLELNKKLFPHHISSILDDALVGVGTPWLDKLGGFPTNRNIT
jgi:hypothetical protein